MNIGDPKRIISYVLILTMIFPITGTFVTGAIPEVLAQDSSLATLPDCYLTPNIADIDKAMNAEVQRTREPKNSYRLCRAQGNSVKLQTFQYYIDKDNPRLVRRSNFIRDLSSEGYSKLQIAGAVAATAVVGIGSGFLWGRAVARRAAARAVRPPMHEVVAPPIAPVQEVTGIEHGYPMEPQIQFDRPHLARRTGPIPVVDVSPALVPPPWARGAGAAPSAPTAVSRLSALKGMAGKVDWSKVKGISDELKAKYMASGRGGKIVGEFPAKDLDSSIPTFPDTDGNLLFAQVNSKTGEAELFRVTDARTPVFYEENHPVATRGPTKEASPFVRTEDGEIAINPEIPEGRLTFAEASADDVVVTAETDFGESPHGNDAVETPTTIARERLDPTEPEGVQPVEFISNEVVGEVPLGEEAGKGTPVVVRDETPVVGSRPSPVTSGTTSRGFGGASDDNVVAPPAPPTEQPPTRPTEIAASEERGTNRSWESSRDEGSDNRGGSDDSGGGASTSSDD